MNNLELRKALHKINHACLDCGGEGKQKNPISGYTEFDCKTCLGTGIDIPLEFGCEVVVRRWGRSESEICIFVNYGHDGLMDKDNKTIGYDSNIVFKNLGKPSTEGDLLRALGKKMQYPVLISSNGTNFGTIHYYDEEVTPKLISMMDYDLSKTVETQTQEVTEKLIEILT